MRERAYRLMKEWCDTLLSYSVKSHSPHLDGAILCPACHVIHGRIADLVFPLTLLYVKTGEYDYLEKANRLIEWSQYCLSRPDGSWRNDAGHEWKGITAFSAMSIGEALYHFGDKLPREMYDAWLAQLIQLSDFVYEKLLQIQPVINYCAGTACEQAIAWKLTGDQKYLEKANEAEAICRGQFDENGLLFGEGTPIDTKTAAGCRYIDIGYDMEESLPLLLRYASLTGRQEEFYRKRFRDHMEFLLPDGGIDNSWGSRHNKWTWWGSRTSDGMIEGLALVLDEPLFADACERVLSLYESCTHDGLLGLPMAVQAGEPTCLHHSFCHAKALAALVLSEPAEVSRTVLPCESGYGMKFFQNGNVALVSHRGWRATVSADDVCRYPGAENGGGSMTLLMHGKTPVCAATTREYYPAEPLNMQYLRNADQTSCMTPRLVFENGSDNLTESGVTLMQTGACALCAQGEDWKIGYSFGEKVTITVESAHPAKFILPIIRSGEIVVGDNVLRIGKIVMRAEKFSCTPDVYGFHQVGGFIWLPIAVEVQRKCEITIEVEG
ncbi:MAG: hypothetical protein E7487_06125 [Ruminococcaceae bacterium]|nr:hypothetical protein [Oscillospiraceae bacterium]